MIRDSLPPVERESRSEKIMDHYFPRRIDTMLMYHCTLTIEPAKQAGLPFLDFTERKER